MNPVAMYPHYVQLMKIGMNFTYDKDGPNNDTWKVDIKGELMFFFEKVLTSAQNF